MSDITAGSPLDKYAKSLFSELPADLWPNQFEVPTPTQVKTEELRLGEPGWIRSEDVYWIYANKVRAPFLYRDQLISLVPRDGFDVEVRREAGSFDVHLMFDSPEHYLSRMEAPGTQQVFDDLGAKGGIGSFARILFRTENYDDRP